MRTQSTTANLSGSQLRKVHALTSGVEAGIKELSPKQRRQLFANWMAFVSHISIGIDKFSTTQPDYALARKILGNDFISPEEVRAVYQLQASENETMDALPSEDDMCWLKANQYILVPMPHEHLSVLDIRNLDSKLFYSKTSWDEEQGFAKDERTSRHTSWLAIKKTVVNGSPNKTWVDQNKLLSDVEHVPNAAEFCWAVTIYYKVRGIYLFPDTYVRTSSRDSDDHRVRVGGFDAEGLSVSHCWNYDQDSCFGLSAARKF